MYFDQHRSPQENNNIVEHDFVAIIVNAYCVLQGDAFDG